MHLGVVLRRRRGCILAFLPVCVCWYEGFAPEDASATENTVMAGDSGERAKPTRFACNIHATESNESPIFEPFRIGKETLSLPYSCASYIAAAAGWADRNACCDLCKQNKQGAFKFHLSANLAPLRVLVISKELARRKWTPLSNSLTARAATSGSQHKGSKGASRFRVRV
ncbi:uncharacterized protein BBA_09047 [Beauveria bassiana ARSEF 2860]|uniref:Secreted protein n=1 Tax=Beauveria bassiana (strain ARSEF 2860) TaxID=655819 RepID=J4KLD2_BEAB2|nr:uncharacterized protein BBA_09047 [Beauveria bassiana ARSEF 2860]EJP61999.1 hypothetical protein BBA_09047 [Beauveria bassiana ARSEF 2860]